MPFYGLLVEEQRRRPENFSVSAVSAEPTSTIRDYFASRNIRIESAFQISPSEFPLRGTPTLLIVDDEGVVRKSFVGALGPETQRKLLDGARAGNL
jgi:hypothetical protein